MANLYQNQINKIDHYKHFLLKEAMKQLQLVIQSFILNN